MAESVKGNVGFRLHHRPLHHRPLHNRNSAQLDSGLGKLGFRFAVDHHRYEARRLIRQFGEWPLFREHNNTVSKRSESRLFSA